MQCCNWNTSTFQCWSFVAAGLISLFSLTVSILGLCGVFGVEVDKGWFAGLIGTIIGLWFPRPTIQKHISELVLAKGADGQPGNLQTVYVDSRVE